MDVFDSKEPRQSKSLNSTITVHTGSTQLTYDGVHPSVQGEAIFGACIIAQVQQILDRN